MLSFIMQPIHLEDQYVVHSGMPFCLLYLWGFMLLTIALLSVQSNWTMLLSLLPSTWHFWCSLFVCVFCLVFSTILSPYCCAWKSHDISFRNIQTVSHVDINQSSWAVPTWFHALHCCSALQYNFIAILLYHGIIYITVLELCWALFEFSIFFVQGIIKLTHIWKDSFNWFMNMSFSNGVTPPPLEQEYSFIFYKCFSQHCVKLSKLSNVSFVYYHDTHG